MTIPANSTMVQRCEEIRALLAFERPDDPETNEIEWQSFLHKRHDSYTKFPYDSDDEDEDEDAKSQERQSYSMSDSTSHIKPAKVTHSSEDPETINTRLHTILMQSSHSINTLQSCFNSELALLTSRYAGLAFVRNGGKIPLLVETHELIGDTLSLCAFFLAFPKLQSGGMEFAELLKNAFRLSHTITSSSLLQLFSLRFLSLTLHLFHPLGIPSSSTDTHILAMYASDSILNSYYIDLYEKEARIFGDVGMREVVARWGWLCVGGEAGI
ncbi:hypothetical protein BOTCAL_0505g00010 [Botryotinia calthae]|uniref:Uncharacterized protein n=1 Tax=Botryotinia calthae TaxID=38488 RepID=A0A4Y8CLA3_9HELO|nr:hypothetical protein BOTCAL_0505g00010 [Botryotinia calthae]